jgi:hypothetical protein
VTAERGRGRVRRWFRADPEVDALLPHEVDGLSNIVNDALRAHLRPAYRLIAPTSNDDSAVTKLLTDASEITAFGVRLRRMAAEYRDLLLEKVDSRVAMTFVLVDPSLPANDPLYQLLGRTTGNAHFVDRLLQDVNQSIRFFQELRSRGLKTGTPVEIFGYREIPMCGLTIADEHTERARMIATIFGNFFEATLHPFFAIDPTSNEGRRAYDVFHDYYLRLATRLTDLSNWKV